MRLAITSADASSGTRISTAGFRMKLTRPVLNRRREQAMTLTEVMVTSTIFGLAMAGFLAMHIFALRYDQTVKLKLQACNDARNVLSRVATDIRSAGRVRVGNGDAAQFTEIVLGQRQEGNAIEIYTNKSDSTSYVRYFCDPDDELLKRCVSGAAEVILARSVTNALVFTAEDDQGQVLVNNFNNRVIGVTLKFYQDYAKNGSARRGFLYDYYQIRTKVTRRALE